MANTSTDVVARMLSHLSRQQIRQLLKAHGNAVCDNESTEDLLNTLRQDVDSGEVGITEIATVLDSANADPAR